MSELVRFYCSSVCPIFIFGSSGCGLIWICGWYCMQFCHGNQVLPQMRWCPGCNNFHPLLHGAFELIVLFVFDIRYLPRMQWAALLEIFLPPFLPRPVLPHMTTQKFLADGWIATTSNSHTTSPIPVPGSLIHLSWPWVSKTSRPIRDPLTSAQTRYRHSSFGRCTWFQGYAYEWRRVSNSRGLISMIWASPHTSTHPSICTQIP